MSSSGVSAIVPVYNGAAFLEECLDSLFSQTLPPAEIIVSDDGSTDETPAIAARHQDRVRYVRHPNAGLSAARNAGLAVAREPLVAFLDVDDLWTPTKLADQRAALDRAPAIDVVLGWIQYMRSRSDGGALRFENYLRPIAFFNVSCALFRRTAFEKVGLFDATLRYAEDLDWFLRAREKNLAIEVVDKVTLYYRHHPANMTHGKRPIDLDFLKTLKRSLDRRRAGAADAADLSPVVVKKLREDNGTGDARP